MIKIKTRNKMMDKGVAIGYHKIHPHLLRRWLMLGSFVGRGLAPGVDEIGTGRGLAEDVVLFESKALGPGSVGCERAGNETMLIDAAEGAFCGVCSVIVPRFERRGLRGRTSRGRRKDGRRMNESIWGEDLGPPIHHTHE